MRGRDQQAITCRADNGVDASTLNFCNNITSIINHIGIITGTTLHCVCTSLAIQDIGSTIANQNVGTGVTGCIDVRSTREAEVFNIVTDSIRN